jgi:hypothetical protein
MIRIVTDQLWVPWGPLRAFLGAARCAVCGRRPGRGCPHLNACVTHELRCSRSGPSLTVAKIAAPSRSAENVNVAIFRHMLLPRFIVCFVGISHDGSLA